MNPHSVRPARVALQQKLAPSLCAVSLILLGLLAFARPAHAYEGPGPLLEVHAQANATISPGSTVTYFLEVANFSSASTDGSSVTMTAKLPQGLKAIATSTLATEENALHFDWDCSATTLPASEVSCTFRNANSGDRIESYKAKVYFYSHLFITAEAQPNVEGELTSSFTLEGGGVPPASTVSSVDISSAAPSFGIHGFDQQVTRFDGAPFTRAASHPSAVSTEFGINGTNSSNPHIPLVQSLEPLKDAFAELPPGFVGVPATAAHCTAVQLIPRSFGDENSCPTESQVGVISVDFSESIFNTQIPIFNMVPSPGVPARFGFSIGGTIAFLDASVRTRGDYGLTVRSRDISEGFPILGVDVRFWGVPADPSHDFERHCPAATSLETGGPTATEPACVTLAEAIGFPVPPYQRPPLKAFLRNPTSCTAPGEGLTTTLHVDSWFNPGRVNSDGSPDLSDPNWKSASTTSHEAPGYPYPPSEWGPTVGIDHCEDVPFEPSVSVQPTTNQADSPSGLKVDLSIPQNALTEPDAIAQSDLKGAVVKLPQGMSVNPAQANGLGGCTLKEIDLHGENTEPSCPDSSKVGTVAIKTPLLDHEIEGSVYLAAQKDNPFNSLLALYIVGDDLQQTGTVIKLAGEVKANPQSGQLETVFTNQPQLPFEDLHLELFGGAHGALITPAHCATYTTTSTLTPWSGNAPVVSGDSFKVTGGPGGAPCPPSPAGFSPALSAGTRNPTAAAFSPFSLRLSREDATQRLAGLALTLPKGLLGKPAGIPYCPESALAAVSGAEGTAAAQLASPACPAASRLGSVTVGAGAGPDPFFVRTGAAYLAGPYKGAPLSLAVITPALAGPFDLGSVLVRNALRVDPESAQVSAVSDPLPQILHGIPLDLRDIRVDLDRPGFTLNPTSCDPSSIDGTIDGAEGASAAVSARFQVGECAKLAFKPKLSLRLKGKSTRGAHPGLHATLRMPKGNNANIARTVVALPHSEFLAQNHIKTICTRVQFAAAAGNGAQCPSGSIYGHVRAITPLLDQPLEGPLYLRSSSHQLPDLVAALNGQIDVDLVGRIDSVNGGIRTTFATVPDAPVSKFTLSMPAGKKSLLENSRNLCASTSRAEVLMDGHNGKVFDSRPVLESGCAKSRPAKRQRPPGR